MGLKLFQLSGALPGLGTEITVAGGHIVGIVWQVDQECSIFKAKYCITFGAAVLQNISDKILSGL